MTNFWQLSDNSAPTGSAESSHTGNFRVIPDGTQAPALVKECAHFESSSLYHYPYYEVLFKIAGGEFKGREVKMKIKCFDEKPSIRDRGINLLKRLYDLCNHKPTHKNAPTTQDLFPMVGKIIGIKIAEFIGTKDDGTPSNGNYVSEIHAQDKDFETITGVKLDIHVSPVDSAFSRNQNASLPPDNSLGDDIPF